MQDNNVIYYKLKYHILIGFCRIGKQKCCLLIRKADIYLFCIGKTYCSAALWL
ncbi:hypothetical protein EUBVEN_01582 [Eubacterium ventriosum ATCC 27560]|uniref:Uncharacterized protein n=1 Tax=Eubacterium ventriosum ATCC 27560 TaxID=411463 RepID=A5Z7A0_9FIRM|nr:hypothetical protein EUBVEN_01582 [Eubacterium ventriosum ATCC 27560]